MRLLATIILILTLIAAFLLASCVRIPVPGGKSIQQFGGDLAATYTADPTTGHLTSVDVVSEMHESFKVGAEVAGKFLDTLTMAYFTFNLMKVQETTKQMANAGMTKKQIAAIDAKARTDAAAMAGGLAPAGYTPIPIAAPLP